MLQSPCQHWPTSLSLLWRYDGEVKRNKSPFAGAAATAIWRTVSTGPAVGCAAPKGTGTSMIWLVFQDPHDNERPIQPNAGVMDKRPKSQVRCNSMGDAVASSNSAAQSRTTSQYQRSHRRILQLRWHRQVEQPWHPVCSCKQPCWWLCWKNPRQCDPRRCGCRKLKHIPNSLPPHLCGVDSVPPIGRIFNLAKCELAVRGRAAARPRAALARQFVGGSSRKGMARARWAGPGGVPTSAPPSAAGTVAAGSHASKRRSCADSTPRLPQTSMPTTTWRLDMMLLVSGALQP